MIKIAAKIAFASLLLFAAPQPVYACSCEPPNQRKAFRKARAIFIGEVLEIKESKNQKIADFLGLATVYDIKFKVEKSWKGVKKSEISVVSDNGKLVCYGFDFHLGKKYLVYANKDDLVVISHCMRTVSLATTSEDIPNLNNFFFRLAARILPF